MCWIPAPSSAKTRPRRWLMIPKSRRPISVTLRLRSRTVMTFDLILRQGRIAASGPAVVDIGVRNGRIAAIAAGVESAEWTGVREGSLDGRLLVPGFVDSHIHLDKSCISDRCACRAGSLREAIEAVAAAKRDFTEEDVYARARGTLEKAVVQGTTRMRCHTEVDPRIGPK